MNADAAPSPVATAFARGDFAEVRRLATATRRARGDDEAAQREAEAWLRRIAPPAATHFALWLTLALVLLLGGSYLLERRAPPRNTSGSAAPADGKRTSIVASTGPPHGLPWLPSM